MILSEVQINAVKAAINERRLEIAKAMGVVKGLIRRLEMADRALVVVEEKVDFVYAEGLDVPEGKARQAVTTVNSFLSDLDASAINTDDIETYENGEGVDDVVNKLIALGG